MLVPPPLSYVRSYSSKNTVTSLSALHPPSTPKAALLPAPALEKIMSSVQIWRALTSPYRLLLCPSLVILQSPFLLFPPFTAFDTLLTSLWPLVGLLWGLFSPAGSYMLTVPQHSVLWYRTTGPVS